MTRAPTSIPVVRMVLGATLATLTVLAGMGLLGLSGWFIAATAIAGLQVGGALAFDVFAPSAGIRLLALGRTAARYGERMVTHDATLSVLALLRERLFRGWAGTAGAIELSRQPARLLFRLTSDLDALEPVYLRLLVPFGAAVGAAGLAALIVGTMAPWLGLALGAWLMLVGLGVAATLSMRARQPSMRRALLVERLRSQSIDLVSGQTDLVMTERLASQCAGLQRTDRRLARADLQLNRLDIAANAVYGVAASLTLALVLLGVGVLAGRESIGTAGAALALLIALSAMEPFAALRRGALEAGRSWLAFRRLAPRSAATTALPTIPAAPDAGHALQLAKVCAAWPGSRVDTLQDVSLTLMPGERLAVIGASGAGKSTLMALIAGELNAHTGSVRSLPFAWLSQRADLFQDSLRDNLQLASAQADDATLLQALDSAGLGADVRSMREGLDTRLGEGALGLSAGQARRVALARLLLQSRPLWLLDEPTEALDAGTAADVLQRLDKLGASHSWLLATHLRREARLADRLLVLQHGRVVATHRRGSPGFAAALAGLRPD